MRRSTIYLLPLIVFGWTALARAQETRPILQPIPHFAPQNQADVALRKKYAAQFKDHTAEGELALAKTLRDDSAAEDDLPMKFVELKEARDLAVYGGNFSDSFLAIDMMANTFDINAHDMKQSALALGKDGARLSTPELIDQYISIAKNQLTNRDVDLASKALLLAELIAHDTHDQGLIEHVKQEGETIHAAKREQTRYFNAVRTLQSTPKDPAANLEVGTYLCTQLEQWKAGLPFLTKSGNVKLTDAATKELAEPKDASGMAAVGDAWWAAADADAMDPAAARKHAADWYAKAEPNLTGEAKKTAADRIAFAHK